MKKSVILAIFLLFRAGAARAETEVYIGVENQREVPKTALALASFLPSRLDSPEDLKLAETFRDIVRSDLLYSRYFDLKEEPLNTVNLSSGPEAMAFWKNLAGHLITAKASDLGKVWTFSGRIYDLETGKVLLDKYYQGEPRALRRAAHLFADDAVLRLTGRRGIAHSKLAFANNTTGNKEIYSIDYDGENLIRLTHDKSIALLPRWSQDASRIYYTTYRYNNPDMFEIDMKAGKIRPFTTFQGLNIPGGISPDGMTMVMTLSRGDDPNIYALDVVTKALKKLLTNFAVSSSPTYSPDGKQIAFISNRSGNPQVHVLETDSGKIRRLTRLNWCDSPSWSPAGDWIVFSGRETPQENMNIFLTDLTGGQIRRLTNKAGNNEDPSWSPDGRFIAFTSTRRGRREIFIMDSDGSAPHPLTELEGNSYTPNWGP
ncbi:MAG: DPP IV N-terminal domain-containing protein [Elusimicrobia bacterium]|nr:DPP IV N-terminal domain-containing protein [Elusimicrobiota bacterium]